MANSFFKFKQFAVHQDQCAMKVTTDACLFGAWAAKHVKQASNTSIPANILDIGAGTGLLSLIMAQQIDCNIDALEIEESAFGQMTQNFQGSPWHDRLHPIHHDVRTFAFAKKYDIIISNPPFYQDELRSSRTEKNRAHHDESLLMEDVLGIIRKNLSDSGSFYLLFPFKRIGQFRKHSRENDLEITHEVLIRQTPLHSPFRVFFAGRIKMNKDPAPIQEEVIIRDKDNQYSREFVDYLKSYYLYL